MKTLYINNDTNNFVNLSFDVLTSQELDVIKGGKSDDSYILPTGTFIYQTKSFKFKH